MWQILARVFGSRNQRLLKSYERWVNAANALEQQMQSLETRSQDRTPGLSRVPFIGSFFKRNQSASNEGELLVFITPRILKHTEAVAAQTNPVNGAGK